MKKIRVAYHEKKMNIFGNISLFTSPIVTKKTQTSILHVVAVRYLSSLFHLVIFSIF